MLQDKKYMVIEAIFKLKKGNKIIIQKTMANHIFQAPDVSLFGINNNLEVYMKNIK